MRTRVIAAISGYWLAGESPPRGVRIKDTINDGHTQFFRLENVRVCRPGDLETCLAEAPDLLVPKQQIRFVGLRDDRHEAPIKRRNNFVAKAPVDAFVVVGGHQIQGKLHLPKLYAPSDRDPLVLLNSLEDFFSLTDAALIAPNASTPVPVVFANKAFVAGFCVGEPVTISARARAPESKPGVGQDSGAVERTLDWLQDVESVLAEEV